MSKIAIVGPGNMGKAILGGILKEGIYKPEDIIAVCPNKTTLEKVEKEFSVLTTSDCEEAIKKSDIVLAAVKPQILEPALKAYKDELKDKLLVSIIAGKKMDELEKIFGSDKKIVRVMPNTPVLVGEGMSGVCKNKNVSEEEIALILNIFNSFGKAELVEESLFDVITGLSGSGPAYVFMIIEALADGAVLKGMPRAQAYKFASQLLYGSAKMVMETGKHPGELKDMVCSPGGTTIESVAILEEKGLRDAIIKAVVASTEKSIEMSK